MCIFIERHFLVIADDFKSIARGMKKDAYDVAKEIFICPYCEGRSTDGWVCTGCNTALKRTEPLIISSVASAEILCTRSHNNSGCTVKDDDYTRILPYYDAMVKRGI
jgi:hypothetical protein